MTWAIVTGEYPPQPGGVSGYTWMVANALAAAGDRVHVFAPPTDLPELPSAVRVHRLSDTFGARGLRELYAALDALPAPRRVLLQFVLQSFGMRAVNLPFVRSLRRLRGYPLWVMFHEFALDDNPAEDPARRAQAYLTRVLARMAARTADLAWVSTPAWCAPIADAAPACPIRWLPIPSAIATTDDPAAVARIRARHRPPDGTLVGHFGTYRMRDAQEFLREAVPLICRGTPARNVLLLGRGGDAFAAAIVARDPSLAGRVAGTGDLESQELADHLTACDALIQPYSDGVTTRRSSLIAGLALGAPTVTTLGPLTEDFWVPSGAVLFAPPNDVAGTVRELERLLSDDVLRRTTAERARALYASRFDVSLTVAALRGT